MRVAIQEAIKKHQPDYGEYLIFDNGSELFFMPNPEQLIGGLYIELIDDNIWFRGCPPCSGGCLDSISEMIDVIAKICADELIIAVGFKGDQWQETTLNFSNQGLALEEGVDYQILSWSGNFDKKIKAA